MYVFSSSTFSLSPTLHLSSATYLTSTFFLFYLFLFFPVIYLFLSSIFLSLTCLYLSALIYLSCLSYICHLCVGLSASFRINEKKHLPDIVLSKGALWSSSGHACLLPLDINLGVKCCASLLSLYVDLACFML